LEEGVKRGRGEEKKEELGRREEERRRGAGGRVAVTTERNVRENEINFMGR